MPTEVASTEYGVITHHYEWNTLELRWLPTTKTPPSRRDPKPGWLVRGPKATRLGT